MLTSLALIILIGLAFAKLCERLRLPRIIGYLLAGICIGPSFLNWLDPSILSISADLRRIALVIILIKAGLSLNLNDLKQVGRPALLMSFLPASFEILGFVLFAPALLHISLVEAALMGSVVAAVSPAVVVPRMVTLMEKRYGTSKSIPQMILAGASLDDVFVIVLFSTFCDMAQGGSAQLSIFLSIPVSIVLGLLLGAACGWMLSKYFTWQSQKGSAVPAERKAILVLGLSFLMLAVEALIKLYVSLSGLLAVLSLSMMVARDSQKEITLTLQKQFGSLWTGAEIFLFVLVGAAVDVQYAALAGARAVLMIGIALIFRCVGVSLCLLHTHLNKKERLFCMIAYLPKATVQAAIGSTALDLGLSCGPIVLSVAVLAILITAPLGAIGMDQTYFRLLSHDEKPKEKPEASAADGKKPEESSAKAVFYS